MARAALLLRVSSDIQRQDRTIETQEQEARDYFRREGIPWEEVRVYRDEGISGDVPIFDRPGGKELRRDIEAGAIGQMVVVPYVDRIAREDIRSYFELEELCERHDLALRSIAEGLDASSEAGQIMGPLYAAFARKAKRDMLRRTQAGRRRAAAEGRWPGGPAPYGYQIDDAGRLALDPLYAPHARRVFELYASGLSANAVARTLQEEGIPTRPGESDWSHRRIVVMLQNPVYRGEARYNWRRTRRARGQLVAPTYRDASEWITIPAPRIVSEELWQRCEKNRTRHSNYGSHASRTYSLRGLLKCPRCDGLYIGSVSASKSGRYYYYRHNRRTSCDVRAYLPAPDLEAAIWRQVVAAMQQPGEWLDLLHQHYESNAEPEEAERQLAQIERQLGEIARRESLLLEVLERGTIAPALYDQRWQQLQRERESLHEQAATLRRGALARPQREAATRSALEEAAARTAEGVTPAMQQEILSMLLEVIWIEPTEEGFLPVLVPRDFG